MLNSIVKSVSKIFGNKSDRDIKALMPRVEEINQYYEQYKSLTNDEIRAKSQELRQRIQDYVSDINTEMEEMKNEVNTNVQMPVDEKEAMYKRIDELKKERNERLEEILDEILPEAFAVVKDTARRFTENEKVEATASDFDRDLAAKKANIEINGDKVYYANTWDAAGSTVTWNMVHYDVQLIGGMVLHSGKISEMATGEGKTLVSTLPVFLNALAGAGVHLVTVNDYLARRDCEWNAPIFQFHGISVDCIDYYRPNSAERRQAYLADVTYGTNNEFGFDYLRDNMAHSPDDLVQREHHYSIIDEVDSVLIDDARTPLIISGPVPRGDIHEFDALKPRVQKLVEAQKKYTNNALTEAKKLLSANNEKEGGLPLLRAFRGLPKSKALIKFLSEQGMRQILQKTENHYLQDQQREMHKVDAELFFVIDEKQNSIELTEKGIELITQTGEDPNFFVMPDVGAEIADIEKTITDPTEQQKKKEELMRDFSIKSERIHSMHQLLKAYTLFERDVEYIVDEGKIKIVDEQTGRVMDGRRYSDGLHQALEAKESVKVEAATQTHATITLQNFFRMYHKLAGMTGTAETEAGEFWEIYKLDVVVIPTNRPIARNDMNDLVFKTTREKYNAVIEEVERLTKEENRPVLVGTTSVEVSELLSKMLRMRGIKHNVLNAKQHQREAEVVAEAGLPGAVTIATNMAGRGTDIKLGPGVKDAGGLAIVGTERHESRRVDRQLRGRAGRQGDPGSSQFFVSLEDNLMRLFGSERIAKVMDFMNHKEGEYIEHSSITGSIERAQRKVEQNHFGIRKRLLEYDDVMNAQREVIYAKRKNALFGDRLAVDIDNMTRDLMEEIVNEQKEYGSYEDLKFELLRVFAYEPEFEEEDFLKRSAQDLADELYDAMQDLYTRNKEAVRETAMPVLSRIWADKGETVDNVGVPFTDGIKNVQIVTDLKKTIESDGLELNKSFEKVVTLATIDEEWKEHLRELDEVKQSAQNQALAQKDPLLIYKLESFNQFKLMMSRLNREVLSLLFKGRIATDNSDQVREARESRTDMSGMQTKREGIEQQATPQGADPRLSASGGGGSAPTPQAPRHVEQKVGRNDPCPCGSGKKFKKCHGLNA